jgi:3-dehydroquinate synthase
LLNTPNHLLHGEAIAIGMAVETILSSKTGLSEPQQQEIFSVLKQHFSMIHIDEDMLRSILEFIKQDKKNSHSTINCSLLTTIGNCAYDCAITEQEVVQAVKAYNTFI